MITAESTSCQISGSAGAERSTSQWLLPTYRMRLACVRFELELVCIVVKNMSIGCCCGTYCRNMSIGCCCGMYCRQQCLPALLGHHSLRNHLHHPNVMARFQDELVRSCQYGEICKKPLGFLLQEVMRWRKSNAALKLKY